MRRGRLRAVGAEAAAGGGARGPLNARDRPALRLLGKPDCHLCREMRALVERVLGQTGGILVEVDVRSDPELERRYLFEIPVLLLDGVEIARHRIGEVELRSRLAERGIG